MPGYHIEWTIELEAATPEEAARAAMKIQRDPNSWRQVFDVTNKWGETVRVDLNEMIQNEKRNACLVGAGFTGPKDDLYKEAYAQAFREPPESGEPNIAPDVDDFSEEG